MKTNKFILFVLLCSSMATFAQDHFDALRISQTDISGTARYVGMSGAFGALGGDVSAIKDNPAGLGVFRASEVTMTFNPQFQITEGNWNGKQTSTDDFNFNYNQAAFVVHFSGRDKVKGLVSSNVSFQYNRIKDFNRKFGIKSNATGSSMTDYMAGYTQGAGLSPKYLVEDGLYNNYDPWEGDTKEGIYPGWLSVLANEAGIIGYDSSAENWHSILAAGEQVTPSYIMRESGWLDEYNLSWAGNISHKFYIGASLNVRSFDYSLSSTYSEDFAEGGYFDLQNELYTSGSGINFGVGIIARPANFLRLGFSFQTPTWMAMRESNYAKIESLIDKKHESETPNYQPYSTYELTTPLKLNGSAAFVFGKRGLLSLEYNFENYTHMKLSDPSYGEESFAPENEYVKEDIRDVHTAKVGLELNLTSNFAVRGGYAFQTAATKETAFRGHRENSVRTDTQYLIDQGTQYASAGIGYRNRNWIVDLAYQYKLRNEKFHAYSIENNEGAASLSTDWHNVVLTLGYRF